MAGETPFSGGKPGENTNTPTAAPTGVVKSFLDLLTDKATPRYLVGQEGNQVLLSFLTTGMLTIDSKTSKTVIPFRIV